ncbi:MAG TPA: NADP-dependent oxidoreductase [Puia sp.]|nr:NADP-dependent oxidoreductase [Puia sp.]
MTQKKEYKAVKFDHYGGLEVLHIDELPLPVPGNGEVLVRVKAAGINPIETKIREGLLAVRWPATFPEGEGSDFAGVVASVGPLVDIFAEGDEVIGFTNNRASHAEYVLVPMEQLTPRPPHVPWEQAGALFTSGSTAYETVRAVSLKKGETVVVSSAAGGVGSITVQLALHVGARVIGLASEDNHAWLKQKGVIPVDFVGDAAEKIKAAAGGPIDAFIDTYGHGYVDLAIQLGVKPDRIDTIVDPDHVAVKKYGVKNDGSMEAATAPVLAELAALIEQGRLEIPIAHAYKLDQVREAFAELEGHHTLGKIVLEP